MAFGIGEGIMLISALASLIGGGASAASKRKSQERAEEAAEEQQEKQDRLAMRQAMARSLGVTNEPYMSGRVPMPKPPSTAWSDALAGVGQVGMQAGAYDWSKRMYPTSGAGGIRPQAKYPYEAL
jgi:type II secretory pathway pseudopilin PulG